MINGSRHPFFPFFIILFFVEKTHTKKSIFCQSILLHSVSSEHYIHFLKAKNKSSGKGKSMFDKGVCSHSDILGLNFIYLLNPFSDSGTAYFLSSVSIQLIPSIMFMCSPGESHFEDHSITTWSCFLWFLFFNFYYYLFNFFWRGGKGVLSC